MAQDWGNGRLRRLAIIGAVLALAAPATEAVAARYSRPSVHYGYATRSYTRAMESGVHAARARYAGRYSYNPARYGYAGRLQCVPFARENSGIELTGNAHTWWNNAEGIYERGAKPEVGSVLSFRANGRMRMGHVAVVSSVVNGRTAAIDHANWGGPGVGPGGITRNMTVVDVSEANDWTAVRLSLGNGDYGSVYPTYGFIYDRPDRGTMLANTAAPTPAPLLAAAPRDLRPAAERVLVSLGATAEEEVAEAPEERQPRMRQVAVYRTASYGGYARIRGADFIRPARGADFIRMAPVQQLGRAGHGGRQAPVVMVGLRTRAPVASQAPSRSRAAASVSSIRRDTVHTGTKRPRSRA